MKLEEISNTSGIGCGGRENVEPGMRKPKP